MKYDFLIVGAGFFGAVCARELTNHGYKCLVIDKRNHIAGNAYTEYRNNIHVHTYGPHIFHTNSDVVWQWVNKHIEFKQYQFNPLANYNGEIYPLPFNMFTFNKMWNVNTPQEAQKIINQQKYNGPISNLEDQALALVGTDIYTKLIKEYTAKQWGMDPKNLPAFIIKRLPVRLSYDNNYFNDKYQGIPIGGYTKLFKNILNNIDIELNIDFFNMPDSYKKTYKHIIYTGPIDRYFNYEYGKLQYRSLEWDVKTYNNIDNYQGCAVMNYTNSSVPYTRSIEHKFFDLANNQTDTIVSYEYPKPFDDSHEPFYPINDTINDKKYQMYYEASKKITNTTFGGRLAEFRYYDMHQVIASALKTIKIFLS